MEPIEAWGIVTDQGGFLVCDSLTAGTIDVHGKRAQPCLILPNLTTADWNALMALVRAADDCSFGPVLDLPPEIIAAAREGR